VLSIKNWPDQVKSEDKEMGRWGVGENESFIKSSSLKPHGA
jgi:hypothetical protein